MRKPYRAFVDPITNQNIQRYLDKIVDEKRNTILKNKRIERENWMQTAEGKNYQKKLDTLLKTVLSVLILSTIFFATAVCIVIL
jgi:hypothetical protein